MGSPDNDELNALENEIDAYWENHYTNNKLK